MAPSAPLDPPLALGVKVFRVKRSIIVILAKYTEKERKLQGSAHVLILNRIPFL